MCRVGNREIKNIYIDIYVAKGLRRQGQDQMCRIYNGLQKRLFESD